ncbi:MAG: sialate O-acetylesterase [Bacteroidales bacterium]|nr:sialate O-acetylesterase [Bacteroidales bacterium]
MNIKLLYKILAVLMLLPFPAFAQLDLAGVFFNEMVIQRDQPINIWGKAAPGQRVTVSFGAISRSGRAGKDSTWMVTLPAQKANTKPQELLVRAGNQQVARSNILVGDVWLCIGQSNMEWPMVGEAHYQEEVANSDQPLIRFFNPTYAGKNIYGTVYTDSVVQMLLPERFYQGRWQVCDSSSFRLMSAVAYYFGKEIKEQSGVPVGLINLSIGGAPLETFIDINALERSRRFSDKAKGDWLINNQLPVWVRDRGKQNVGELAAVPADEYGKNHPYKPGFAYLSGIQPLIQMGIRGVICYQGESNAQEADRVEEYGALTKLMVDDYRRKWNNRRLPFYYVQLSSIDTVRYNGYLWPDFRDEQRKMLQMIPHSGMAVCSDIGARDNVHPTDKRTVGKRLARWALNDIYKLESLPSGPLPIKAHWDEGQVTVTFCYVGEGLATADSLPVRGFSLDGKVDTEASISGNTIVIKTTTKPGWVYYGWKSFSDGNLVNSEQLPASTFRLVVR